MSFSEETLTELAKEYAKKAGSKIEDRLKEAGNEITDEDRKQISKALKWLASFALEGTLTAEEEARRNSWRSVLASYEYVTADILKGAQDDALKLIMAEVGEFAAVFGKSFARGLGVPIP